jgi:uncharacterized membrane protein
MKLVYVLHVLAGTLGLLTGYAALYVSKGSSAHRRIGMVFVYTMLTMSVFGMAIAIGRGIAPEVNIPAALITAYLIITAVTTVRPGFAADRSLHIGLMLAALGTGVMDARFAFEAFANGGTRNGMPAFPFVMFGTIAFLAVAGDLRVLRSGARTGASRIARHLWRMCIALFIAALSASFQFSRMVPRELRIPVMVIPMFVALGCMCYWLWRVRFRKSLRGLMLGHVTQAA